MPTGSEARGERPDEGLPAARRLRATGLFAEAYDQNRCQRGRYMLLWLRRGPDAALRLGVVTSRKVGDAVARVKARRRMRELFRRRRSQMHGAFDVVLIARASLPDAPWAELVQDFQKLAARAGLLASGTGQGI
jgi:ribonuclease P protein component